MSNPEYKYSDPDDILSWFSEQLKEDFPEAVCTDYTLKETDTAMSVNGSGKHDNWSITTDNGGRFCMIKQAMNIGTVHIACGNYIFRLFFFLF